MLLTFLLIKGVPGRKPYLAYDISFGETKGKLLPKNFIPHLIDGFLNEGPGQIICGDPISLKSLIELDNIAKA